MTNKNAIEETIAKALEAQGYELVDLIIQNQGSKKLLQFFADKAGGLTLADCETLTNKIDAVLEMENLIDGAYILEVSSPGLRRVLKKPAHFQKFVGERAKIFTKEPIENRGVFTGVITSADEAKFTLEDGTTKFTFKYEDVKKANLDPVVEF
ncbi:MAG: ribosome maturation factor RimP [Elusimicrobiota bacterium]|jgi:ribosome maturation factor RimP|nr:ribosome maturation factor RimP [Elusimicrobiota bacterium]